MASSTCFCFLDGPAEVRYIIYRELLCGFTFEDNALARLLRQPGANAELNQAMRPFHTSILRVSREIHRQAYDVMVKIHRFIYVSSTRFSLDLEYLLRQYQVPFLTLNRAHVQQFRDYMMYVYIDSTRVGMVKQPGEDFVVMMLGRHWGSLCAALSHPKAPSTEYDIDLAFPTCSTANRSQYMSSTPYSFHCKAQASFLECTKTYLRGVKKLRVYGSIDPDLSTLVQKAVTSPPPLTRPQWLSSPNQWIHLAHSLQQQDRHIEAFGLWNVVHHTPSHILQQAMDALSHKRLLFTSHLGTALCYLHFLEPIHHSTLTETKVSEIKDLAEQSIHAAWKRRVTDNDRARVFSLKCRLFRLSYQRRSNRTVGYGPIRRMDLLMCRAERYDGLEPMVVDERWRLRWWRSRVEVDGEFKNDRDQWMGEGKVAVRWPFERERGWEALGRHLERNSRNGGVGIGMKCVDVLGY